MHGIEGDGRLECRAVLLALAVIRQSRLDNLCDPQQKVRAVLAPSIYAVVELLDVGSCMRFLLGLHARLVFARKELS